MSGRVLVADDSDTMRRIILRSLRTLGVHDGTEAADATEAVELFRPGCFDLVVMDWNMPGMEGPAVVKAIRDRDAGVPVIVVALEVEEDYVREAAGVGAFDYLVKPFTIESLRRKLEKHGCAVAPGEQ